MINNMLFFSNLIFHDPVFNPQTGNLFIPLKDDAVLFNFHGEINGVISDKISYNGKINYYNYKLSNNEYPWSKQPWDGQVNVKYNLRDKIIAGVELSAMGKRKFISTKNDIYLPTSTYIFKSPMHVNINLNAEYRYTKILSFWLKVNNIAFNRNYDWAFYPTQRFMGMLGLTYSL